MNNDNSIPGERIDYVELGFVRERGQKRARLPLFRAKLPTILPPICIKHGCLGLFTAHFATGLIFCIFEQT